MEDLKSYSLYNQHLNKLIKSYTNKNPYSLQSLEASLRKNYVPKTCENKNKPTKFLYINSQFDETMKINVKNSDKKLGNMSLSKFLMNYDSEKNTKNELLPVLKGLKGKKLLVKSKNKSHLEMNKTLGSKRMNTNINYESNDSKIRSQNLNNHNFLLYYDSQTQISQKPYTPIKISINYRKNFGKKVDGKFEVHEDPKYLNNTAKSLIFNSSIKNWD